MLFTLNSSLSRHIISQIRNKQTEPREFKRNIEKISILLACEAMKDFETEKIDIETPISTCSGERLNKKITLIPVLRAGLPMADALHEFLDNSTIGHIGLYRDPETVKPIEYYVKVPNNIENSNVLICDPLIATGNSIIKAIEIIKRYNVSSITVLSVISAKPGIENIRSKHPDIKIYTGAVDERMNDHSYIVPGAGDAGDRIFDTK